jgi:protein-S-isoprenylcysteine O-methyltransferase Ste14
MEIVSFFYAAFGYLALLAAILLGMLFVGEGSIQPYMDAAGSAAPRRAALVDLSLLLLLALLHRWARRGMLRRVALPSTPRWLERGAQSWMAAAVLVVIYLGWQSLPQVLWNVAEPLQAAFSALFYLAWTLILIGTFLADHLNEAAPRIATVDSPYVQALVGKLKGMLGEPLYAGILIAMWATSIMSAGHLLMASAVTAYLVFDCAWSARRTRGAIESRRTMSFQGQGVAR